MTDWFTSPLCTEETCQHLRPEVNRHEESPTCSFLKRDASEYLPFVVEMRVQNKRDDCIIESGFKRELKVIYISTRAPPVMIGISSKNIYV